MTSPRTHVEEGITEFERDLLRSYKDEEPSARARQRALGLAAGATLAGATTTTSAAGAVHGTIAAALTPKAGALVGVGIVKWFAAGAILAVGTAVVLPQGGQHDPTVIAPSAAEPEPALSSVVLPPATPIDPRSTANADEPSIDRAITRSLDPVTEGTATVGSPRRMVHSKRRPTDAVVADPTPSEVPTAPKRNARELGEQVTLLDRAERALASGDADQALRVVDEYERRFPGGSLLQEATVVRIGALLTLGKKEEAARAGAGFIASHPASPYAAKVRRHLQNGTDR